MRRAWHLKLVVDVENCVKERVIVGQVYNGPVGKYPLHALFKDRPFQRAMKVVGHEKAASQQIVAQNLSLVIGDAPLAHLHCIEPRPVERFVRIFDVHHLLDRANLHAREPSQGLREVAVRARIVLRPQRQTVVVVAVEAPSVAVIGAGRKHHTGEGEFGFLGPIRWRRHPVVLHARIFPE